MTHPARITAHILPALLATAAIICSVPSGYAGVEHLADPAQQSTLEDLALEQPIVEETKKQQQQRQHQTHQQQQQQQQLASARPPTLEQPAGSGQPPAPEQEHASAQPFPPNQQPTPAQPLAPGQQPVQASDSVRTDYSLTSLSPHRRFSLKACFDKADSDNKEIGVATANLPISQAAIIIARAIPNPTFSLTYGWGNAYRYILAGNNQIVGWTEEIQVAGKRTKKTNVAQANLIQTAFQIEAARFDVHNRMRRAYAELAAAIAYQELMQAQRAITQDLLGIAQKRYTAGKAPYADVLQAKLAVAQFDTQLNQAQGRLLQDSAGLAQLLGETPRQQEIIEVDANSLFKLSAERNTLMPDPDRAPPALQALLPAAWRERNDLKAAMQQAYAGRKALTLAKSQRIPNPTLGFNYMFSNYRPFEPPFFDPVFGKVPQQAGYMLSLQQETPIFYQYQGQVNQAKAAWLQEQKQSEVTRTQVAVDIVTAYTALLVAIENVHKYQNELLPEGLQVSHMSRRAYELGKVDLATAMLAQQQYQQLRSSYFDAIVAYQNAWADLEKAMGVPLNL